MHLFGVVARGGRLHWPTLADALPSPVTVTETVTAVTVAEAEAVTVTESVAVAVTVKATGKRGRCRLAMRAKGTPEKEAVHGPMAVKVKWCH